MALPGALPYPLVGSPPTAPPVPSVGVVATWTGSFSLPDAPPPPAPPGTLSLPVTVANADGHWMVAIIAWRDEPGYPAPNFTVSDNALNWWEPLKTPGLSVSSASGLTRISAWMAPAARAATTVMAAPSAFSQVYAMIVYEVAGMAPWISTLAVTGFANSSGAITENLGAPASQAFVLAACASDSFGSAPLLGTPGWSAVTTINATDGTDTDADLSLCAAWQITSAATTAAWTTAASVNLAAISGLALTAAPALTGLSRAWPAVIYETAPGSGAQSPPDTMSWQALSGQALTLDVTQGRQYEASALSTGEGTLKLDNPLGNLIPPGTGALAGIDAGTPVRVRTAWPGGSWQLSFTGDGVTASPGIWTNQIFTVLSSQQYSASAWLACNPAWAPGVALTLAFYNASGTLVGSAVSPSATTPLAVLALASGTSPATAAYAAVTIQASGIPPSSTVFYASAAPPQP